MGIVLSNNTRKGGVGKSVLNYELSYILSHSPYNYKVLLISTDSQCDLDIAVGVSANDNPKTILDAMKGECGIRETIIKTKHGFDFIRSDKGIANVSRMFDPADELYIVQDAIEYIKDEYDFIIFDCGADRGVMNLALLVASDYIIVPCVDDNGSMNGIFDTKADIDGLTKRKITNVKLLGAVLNRVERDNSNRDSNLTLNAICDNLNIKHFSTIKKQKVVNKTHKELFKPVTAHSPWSDVSVELRRFAKEIIIAIGEDKEHGN